MNTLERTSRVCVVGSLNIDITARVSALPAPGETVLGTSLVRSPGGKGGNQALAAARAGVGVMMVGRIGDDDDGARYVRGLRERGVGCLGVRTTPGTPTGTALVVVDQHGENSIVVVAGANAAVTPADVDDASAILRRSDVLLLQLELTAPAVEHAARIAADAGVRVVLNASPWTAPSAELLALADVVIVNEREAAQLGDAASSVCVTLGAGGARWGTETAAAPRITPVDTTGAGDAFAGALAAAIARGADRAGALRAAVRAGAKACEHHGAQGWTLDQVAEKAVGA